MDAFKAFLKRKDIEISLKRYGIDALGAMAQGLFCSLLIGTIIRTLGQQLHLPLFVDIGTYAMAVSGPAMAIAIGYALKCPPPPAVDVRRSVVERPMPRVATFPFLYELEMEKAVWIDQLVQSTGL